MKPCAIKLLAAWLLFLSAALTLAQASEASYADDLVEAARVRRLDEKRGWRVLLHYKKSLLGSTRSLVDDQRFFLSKDGKRDPAKELEATIRAFFNISSEGDSHPRCVFPARYDWLREELGIEEGLLPGPDCRELNELLENLKPESAVLVFPVSHMNSPASMFGHTLLRIDSASETKLLSYAVNYSAVTRETNGILFAFKGIFGFYEGYFSLMPYYEKIKEYGSLENRDIWEYRLAFTRQEVMRIVKHMWELKDIYSDYYFFDENCSYNLLLALEAGRPGADLTGRLPAWVIPMDTIRAVREKDLFEGEPAYRPSRATRIRFMEGLIPPLQSRLALDISLAKADPERAVEDDGMGREDKIRALDLSAEYLQYRYSKKEIGRDGYLRLYLKILGLRSSLGRGLDYAIPAPKPPEAGHSSARFSIGMGVKKGAVFNTLSVRPANHGLLDPDEGYLQGAAISFLDTEFRYNNAERKLSLERATLLEIDSLSPIDAFFRPVSWRVEAGVVREEFSKRVHRTVLSLSGGPGASAGLSGWLIYAFLEPQAKFGGGLESDFSVGAGLRAGALKALNESWKTQIEASASSFVLGDRHSIAELSLNQRYTINPGNALMLGIKREKFEGFYSNEVLFSWNRYF